jgi:hypothetical protein
MENLGPISNQIECGDHLGHFYLAPTLASVTQKISGEPPFEMYSGAQVIAGIEEGQ